MGIKNLFNYINENNTESMLQTESGNHIYSPTTLYIDITSKLVSIYNDYCRINNTYINSPVTHNDQFHYKTVDKHVTIDGLLKYVCKELTPFLNKFKKFNQTIYIFIDYRFRGPLLDLPLLYNDFIEHHDDTSSTKLTQYIDKHEQLKDTPMLKRKYLHQLLNNPDINFINKLINKVYCQYELRSIYEYADNKFDLSKYINLRYVLHRIEEVLDNANNLNKDVVSYIYSGEQDNQFIHKVEDVPTETLEIMKEVIELLIKHAHKKYILHRFSKIIQKHQRSSTTNTLFSKREHIQGNFNKSLLKSYIIHKNLNKVERFKNTIPFSILIYAFPSVISKLNIPGITYYGCEFESDFAITKHIETYTSNTFPIIYTGDTDMLCLLSDVDCIIELQNVNGTHFINPIKFWRSIFGCDLHRNIVRILCVLMGTGLNPWFRGSCIHIDSFEDILPKLGKKSFKDIDETELRTWIYAQFDKYNNKIEVSQTAIALNIYLNGIESELHQIAPKVIDKSNICRFLQHYHACMF